MPRDYEEWRVCIIEKCGIPLTEDYLRRRCEELSNASSSEVQRFRELYGDAHWRKIASWFERARNELTLASEVRHGGHEAGQ